MTGDVPLDKAAVERLEADNAIGQDKHDERKEAEYEREALARKEREMTPLVRRQAQRTEPEELADPEEVEKRKQAARLLSERGRQGKGKKRNKRKRR